MKKHSWNACSFLCNGNPDGLQKKLVQGMRNSTEVISAWDGSKLVGLVRGLSGGATVAFLHYLLVDPA